MKLPRSEKLFGLVNELALVTDFIVTFLIILLFQWRYCIRIENLGQETVQLRERHWRIFSLSGTLETVRGRGVAGQVRIGDGRQGEGGESVTLRYFIFYFK